MDPVGSSAGPDPPLPRVGGLGPQYQEASHAAGTPNTAPEFMTASVAFMDAF